MDKQVSCRNLSYNECELAILRSAVDRAEGKMKRRQINSNEIRQMIQIVESFLRQKKLICYGGQSINEELPEEDRFYNKELDLPDYDFFTPHALDDAKELADMYAQHGFKEVEAKAGLHHGTYKVFVSYIPIADLTSIHPDLFHTLKREAIESGGILYAPPNYLRMLMYLELSRPAGFIGRWEKVAKRLALLNKNYPLTDKVCTDDNFQRRMELGEKDREQDIFRIVKDALVQEGAVFFGGFAIAHYGQYMPASERRHVEQIADFDAIVKRPRQVAEKIKRALESDGIKQVAIESRPPIDEIVPPQIEISVGGEPVAVLYQPVACYSFNTIKEDDSDAKIRIATIDTMLSLYLAFLYANKPYYDPDRIVCMAKYLYDVQQRNLLKQKGLLRRFTITCYGRQPSIEEMRAEKARKFNELKGKRGTRIYEEWFLNYRPPNSEERKGVFVQTRRNKYMERKEDRQDKDNEEPEKKFLRDRSGIQPQTRGSVKHISKTKKRRKKKPKLFDPYGALRPFRGYR